MFQAEYLRVFAEGGRWIWEVRIMGAGVVDAGSADTEAAAKKAGQSALNAIQWDD